MVQQIVVEVGQCVSVRRLNDEDGPFEIHDPCYRVGFSTAYGIVYAHHYAFPLSDEGLRRATVLAGRVQAKIDAEGVDRLDGYAWGTRTIYGSHAYVDEEPYLVEREKSDALLNEAFG